MLIADLIHSCSNDKVAQAALACIGGSFAERVSVVAQRMGLSSGRFVALVVRDFSRRADAQTQVSLFEKIAGCDQPLLLGLRHVVEPALERGAQLIEDFAIEDFAIDFNPSVMDFPVASAGNYH